MTPGSQSHSKQIATSPSKSCYAILVPTSKSFEIYWTSRPRKFRFRSSTWLATCSLRSNWPFPLWRLGREERPSRESLNSTYRRTRVRSTSLFNKTWAPRTRSPCLSQRWQRISLHLAPSCAYRSRSHSRTSSTTSWSRRTPTLSSFRTCSRLKKNFTKSDFWSPFLTGPILLTKYGAIRSRRRSPLRTLLKTWS